MGCEEKVRFLEIAKATLFREWPFFVGGWKRWLACRVNSSQIHLFDTTDINNGLETTVNVLRLSYANMSLFFTITL